MAGIERRALGSTGLEVSALGFGCGAVGGLMVGGDRAEQARSVGQALEAGINYFDTAPSYGDGVSEENLGRCLRELGARERVVVGTKVRFSAAELDRPAVAVRRSLEASLERLRLDHVELLHLHNPVGLETGDDANAGVPTRAALEDVADGLRRAVEEGLARHVGFTGVGASDALGELAGDPAYETVQAYLNVLNPSAVRAGSAGGQQDFAGLVARAADRGLGVIAIRVYAAGALSAAPQRHPLAGLPGSPLIPGSDYESDLERARRLQRLAAELELESVLELGLRFAIGAPGVSTALVGLSSFEHLDTALRWAGRGALQGDEFDRLVEMAGA